MKKKNVLNLIKYYSENDNVGFKNEAIKIAKAFDEAGDGQLAEYILTVLESTDVLTPQDLKFETEFITKMGIENASLPLPKIISDDIKGILNAVNRNIGIHKFLFEGHPGTGKTETAKQVARLLKKDLYSIDFSKIIDSKMGETSKNIVRVFDELNSSSVAKNSIILFDEIDIIAMDRVNASDIREMGRVTSIILRELDRLSEEVIIIATTNLYSQFDKALTRRFDKVVNFDSYSEEDLIEISEVILNQYLKKFPDAKRDIKLFRKIIKLMEPIPYPGELKNVIKTSLAFSDANDEYGYLKLLLNTYINISDKDVIYKLNNKGFTLREIENLTNISKSKISRDLKGNNE